MQVPELAVSELETAVTKLDLLRGIEKVKAEWALICTAHNLRKLARAVP
jgi:hypothetical protein